MSTACGRPHRGRVVRPMWTHVDRGGGKNGIFCGRHKWMAPKVGVIRAGLNPRHNSQRPHSLAKLFVADKPNQMTNRKTRFIPIERTLPTPWLTGKLLRIQKLVPVSQNNLSNTKSFLFQVQP